MTNLEPAHLISKFLAREATAEEQDQLYTWVSRNPANQRLFEQYSKAWNQTYQVRTAFDLEAALVALHQRIDRERVVVPFYATTLFKLAASLLLVITTTATLWLLTTSEVPLTYVRTGAGEKRLLTLSDGSRVTLNENSTLSYPATFDDGKRAITLEGEAFFDVVRDSLRPFSVHSGRLETRVLGTSFNVQAAPGRDMTVTVLSGRVRVINESHTMLIAPTDKITYQHNDHTLTKGTADMEQTLAWMDKHIEFEQASIHDMSTALHRYYGVGFTFATSGDTQCVLTAKFHNESLNHILDAIAYSTGLRYERTGNRVVWLGTCSSPQPH